MLSMRSRPVRSRVRSSSSIPDSRSARRTRRTCLVASEHPVRIAARLLAVESCYLFFKYGKHFQNPLIDSQWEVLLGDPATADSVLADPAVGAVLEDLVARLPGLARGTYSPVPIARALARGVPLDEALAEFRYEPIHVDLERKWWWQGRPVAERLQRFFLENMGWEPELGLWFFEYRVSDEWYDKSYLDCLITPLTGRSHQLDEEGSLSVVLDNSERDSLDLETLRFDQYERLFAQSSRHGEVMLADMVRFDLLRGMDEDLEHLVVGGRRFRVHWPDEDDSDPGDAPGD